MQLDLKVSLDQMDLLVILATQESVPTEDAGFTFWIDRTSVVTTSTQGLCYL